MKKFFCVLSLFVAAACFGEGLQITGSAGGSGVSAAEVSAAIAAASAGSITNVYAVPLASGTITNYGNGVIGVGTNAATAWDIYSIHEVYGPGYHITDIQFPKNNRPHFVTVFVSTDEHNVTPFMTDDVMFGTVTVSGQPNYQGSGATAFLGHCTSGGILRVYVMAYTGGTYYLHVYEGSNSKTFGPYTVEAEP